MSPRRLLLSAALAAPVALAVPVALGLPAAHAQTGQVQPVQPAQPVQPLQGGQTFQANPTLQVAPSDADRQVQAIMYHRLMAEVIRTGVREQIARGGSAVGDVNPYPSVTSGKALAVCVNWQKTTLDRVTWGGFAYRYGATVTAQETEALKERTLADCQAAYAGRDCGCQLLDVDDRNVLEVPAGFLAEYGRF